MEALERLLGFGTIGLELLKEGWIVAKIGHSVFSARACPALDNGVTGKCATWWMYSLPLWFLPLLPV